MTKASLLLSLAILLSSVVSASADCYEPEKPYCVDAYGPFKSQMELQSCHLVLQSYLDAIQSYISCVDNRILELKREAQVTTDAFRLRIKMTGK